MPIRDSAETSRASNAPTGTEGVTTIPRGGYQNEPLGLRHSSLFRNTSFPNGNPVSLPQVEPAVRQGSVTARVRIDLPSLHGGLPFLQRGFEPQDADLKAGPFYFKLRAVQGAILHSDNINLTPDDERESGTIAIVTATVNVLAQVTESLRLATSISFIYLPLEGKAGIAGFGFSELYSFGLLAGPSTHAQIIYETKIGGWDVVFSDDFRILLGQYSNNVRNDYLLFDDQGFDEQSTAGRYTFGGGYSTRRDDRGHRRDQSDINSDFVVFTNLVAADAQRLLPGPVRMRVRIFREDLWYNQGNRGLPGLREGVLIRLASERVNMRFKPFVSYEALRTERDEGFRQILTAGLSGPITDQLELRAEAGYYFGGGRKFGNDDENAGYLWRVELNHEVGPSTRQSLFYARSFSYFQDEIVEGLGYNLRQILGPRHSADAYVYRLKIEGSDDADDEESFTRRENRAGLRLTYTPGPKTSIQASGNYSHIEPENTDTYTARLDIGYNFSDTLLAHFVYQHQRSTSELREDQYVENLFFLSLTKYFP